MRSRRKIVSPEYPETKDNQSQFPMFILSRVVSDAADLAIQCDQELDILSYQCRAPHFRSRGHRRKRERVTS